MLSCASPLIRQYQTLLDSLVQSDSGLECRLKQCVHCNIRFLSDPRNARREDLRCPFGCAKHHRAQHSAQRVKAYRQTKIGKEKKDALNAKRYRTSRSSTCSLPCREPTDVSPLEESGQLSSPLVTVKLELELSGVVLDESSVLSSPILPYVRTLIWLIDSIRLSRSEVVEQLRQALRQHSMAYQRRRDYVLRFLHQHPP